MSEKIKKGDFVEIDYDGYTKEENLIFDSTSKNMNQDKEHGSMGPVIICVGEHQLLGAIDDALIDAKIGEEKKVDLTCEKAFGKKDAKMLKIVPINVFKKEKIQPYPGLPITIDGMYGTIKTVSGGRVIVDFNHPLSGKDVYYKLTANRFVTDDAEKIVSFLALAMNLPKNIIGVKLHEKVAEVKLPFKVPEELIKPFEENAKRLIGLTNLTFKAPEPGEKDAHGRDASDPHFGHHHQ